MIKVKKTTRINTTINSKLEKRFRDTIYTKWGFKKGNIQRGLEEAIILWLNKEKTNANK